MRSTNEESEALSRRKFLDRGLRLSAVAGVSPVAGLPEAAYETQPMTADQQRLIDAIEAYGAELGSVRWRR